MTAVCSVCKQLVSALEPGASVLVGSTPGLGDQIAIANLADQCLQHILAYHKDECMEVQVWSLAAAHAEALTHFLSNDPRYGPGVKLLTERVGGRYSLVAEPETLPAET